jgi:acyl-CoA reductase-like NAD-dependent aldehyde dehydrogenase
MTFQSLISPIDGSTYASFEITSESAADDIITQARHAQRAWANEPLDARLALCRRFLDAMTSQTDRIARELTWQMGRPIVHTPKEVTRLVERGMAMIDMAENGLANLVLPRRDTRLREVRRVPHGVCLVIAPWNYPYLTAVNTILPALIAGNAVILKPAGQTALTGHRFADAFAAAGFPAGVFSSAPLSHDTIARWIGARRVDFVAFTGSVHGGAEIERAAAGRFLPITLELGGKDPAYVRADADIDFAVGELVDGSFFNSGQSCCGVERIYVDSRVYDTFVDRFVEVTVASQTLGNPHDTATTLGPVVSARAAEGIRRQVVDAVAAGARALTGGDHLRSEDPYMPATVLVGVDHTMSVMTEETFGPVVGIMAVSGDDEALALMNDSRYGLSSSVWTTDVAAGLALGSRVETGTFFVNRCDYLDPGLAWTGIKDTGRGCSLSELGFHHVTRPKSYYAR